MKISCEPDRERALVAATKSCLMHGDVAIAS